MIVCTKASHRDQKLRFATEPLETGDKPVLIGIHHNPMPMGIPYLDKIGLNAPDSTRLAEVLAPYRARINALIHGHTHRTSFANWSGIHVLGQRSQVHQASLALRGPIHVEDSGAALTILETRGSNVMAHIEPVALFDPLSTETERVAPIR